MSDNFEMLVDADATLEEANVQSNAVLGRLRKMGLITGVANDHCVLGGEGYRPGPAVPDLYVLGENECEFWQLRTNGVEPKVGRHFNVWALGPVFQGLTCPACGAYFETYEDAFDAIKIGSAVGEWVK